jgi:FtsZ-interacting cell division protein ZipA
MLPRRLLVISLVAFCALIPLGCGAGDGRIPNKHAAQLSGSVDSIAKAAENSDCARAQARIEETLVKISSLPQSVDRQLVENMRNWLTHMRSRVSSDCQKAPVPVEPEKTTPTEPKPSPEQESQSTDKNEQTDPAESQSQNQPEKKDPAKPEQSQPQRQPNHGPSQPAPPSNPGNSGGASPEATQ